MITDFIQWLENIDYENDDPADIEDYRSPLSLKKARRDAPRYYSPEPTVPTQQPTVPTQQPTVPTQQPTVPTQQPTVPTQQPTVPTQQPTD